MSDAAKCDICAVFFERAKGTMALDVNVVVNSEDGACMGWSEVDLCLSCSAKVLAVIKPALDDYDKEITV